MKTSVHRDEYGEGPVKREEVHTFVCERCGREFQSTKADARLCPRCLLKKIMGDNR